MRIDPRATLNKLDSNSVRSAEATESGRQICEVLEATISLNRHSH